MRKIRLKVEDEVHVACTVCDVPKQNRKPGSSGVRKHVGGNGKVRPDCDRAEGFICEIDAVLGFLRLNKNDRWVLLYMHPTDRTRKISNEIWQHMNRTIRDLMAPMKSLRFDPGNVSPAPEGEEWLNHEDMTVNLFLKERIYSDPYILERTAKIDSRRKEDKDATADGAAAEGTAADSVS